MICYTLLRVQFIICHVNTVWSMCTLSYIIYYLYAWYKKPGLMMIRWKCLIMMKGDIHHCDITMCVLASQITCNSIVCSIVCSSIPQRKHQSFASLAFLEGKRPVTGGFPSQRVSNAENVSMSWLHHAWKECHVQHPVASVHLCSAINLRWWCRMFKIQFKNCLFFFIKNICFIPNWFVYIKYQYICLIPPEFSLFIAV